MKFGMLMRLDPLPLQSPIKFCHFKNQDGGGGHLENLKNRNMSATK